MPNPIKRKKTFGSVTIDHFSPQPAAESPKAVNIHLSFEEALKLHLGLGQLLGHLNGYNRSTRAGRRSAVNLCVYPHKQRITVDEGWTRSNRRGDIPDLRNQDLPAKRERSQSW
jgi:hypothetical protein